MRNFIFLTLLFAISSSSEATNCNVVTTPVGNILANSDGSVYVYTEKANDCGCGNPNAFTFNAMSDKMGKLYYAAALTAKMMGKRISVFGTQSVCNGAVAVISSFNND